MKLSRSAFYILICMIRLASPFHPISRRQLARISFKNALVMSTATHSKQAGQFQAEDVHHTMQPPQLDQPAAYFDAHCHIQLAGASAAAQALQDANEGERMALMSVEPSCWPLVSSLSAEFPNAVVPCYGIHPWYAHKAGKRRRHHEIANTIASAFNDSDEGSIEVDDSDWLVELEQLLSANPSSCVGEIGLDKVWVPPEHNQNQGDDGKVAWDDQVRVFRQQLRLAAKLERPASLHSVRCPGFMFDELRHAQDLPPAVYLHSYTGSAAMVDSLVKLPKGRGDAFYFGFSHFVNGRGALRNRAKTLAVIAAVPVDRLLLESDQDTISTRQGDLQEGVALLAEARGWSEEETLVQTRENAQRFYAEKSSLPLNE